VKGSLRICTAFGIPIQVHWTFLLLALFVANLSLGMLIGLAILFCIVVLHELGHSVVAQRFGIRVLDITLWPLGGMARLGNMPESPKIEALVALAGPAVNFALLMLTLPLLLAAWVAFGQPAAVAEVGAASSWITSFLFYFAFANLLIGTFNLVPAFPMDGGRVLRAWFARKLDWVTATERAVRIGRFIALTLLILALPLWLQSERSFCGLPLVVLFVWFAGGQELFAVRLRHGQFGGLGGAGGAGGPGGRGGFGGFGGARQPETDPGPERPADADAVWRARRPEAGPPGGGQTGFSEEFLRDLESHHRRLRRPKSDDDA
jgi:Zn-dependent protease